MVFTDITIVGVITESLAGGRYSQIYLRFPTIVMIIIETLMVGSGIKPNYY